MKNFVVLEKNLDVSSIVDEINDNLINFKINSDLSLKNIIHCNPDSSKKIILVGGPYVVGKQENLHTYDDWLNLVIHYDSFNNVEFRKTQFYGDYTKLINFVLKKFPSLETQPLRMLLSKLKPGEKIPKHIDLGKMYQYQRFHLSLQGTYSYYVEDEKITVQPGTLFWFNNKKLHFAENIGKVVRISLIFDVDPKHCLDYNLPINEYHYIN